MVCSSRKSGSRVILAAEHDPALFWTICHLRTEGYRVLATCDSQQALDVFCHMNGRIDVALIDMSIPPAGGPVLVSRIQECAADTKFLLLHEDARKASAMFGVSDCPMLDKPFTYRRLLSAVRSIVEHGALVAAAG